MNNLVKKRFDIIITDAGRLYSKTFELDKNIVHIKGLLFTSDRDDLCYYRGSQRIEINKKEIFPEGYETRLLMTGINVSPNVRYYETGDLPIGNGLFKVEFLDTNDSRAAFEPYRVSVYINCEQIL